MLSVAVADESVLCTDGNSLLATAARELDIEHQAVKIARHTRARHIQNVNAYQRRWKGWVRHGTCAGMSVISRAKARAVLERWRRRCNRMRPHSSSG